MGFLSALFGGDTSSSTSSASSQTTTNKPTQQTLGDNSLGLSDVSNSAISYTALTTDHGAIDNSFNLALAGQDMTSKLTNKIIDNSHADFVSGLGFADKALLGVIDSQKNSINSIADAYNISRAGDQKTLVGVGLAVVAIVALSSIKK